MPSLRRWWETARRLTPAQVGWRLYYLAEQRTGAAPAAAVACGARRLPARLFAADHRDRSSDERRAAELGAGAVEFLAVRRQLRTAAGEWAWPAAAPGEPPPSRLWMFHLHSFGFAGAAARCGRFALVEEVAASWVAAWPASAPGARRAAWNGYTISNRLENWAYAEAVSGREFSAAVRASARQQAGYLASHMERDLQGNHLVRNACALLAAAAWLQAPEAAGWRRRAARALAQCLRRQVLADGGHYERSPMYHLLVMEDFAECLGWLRQMDCEPALQGELAGALRKMHAFAGAMRAGDGEIPLLNDSSWGVAPRPAEALALVDETLGDTGPAPGTAPGHLWRESGFAVLQEGPWRVIVDGGPLGPDEQPGHAHCDLGALTASFGTVRVLEDTGVFEYEAGERRRYARSTAAHSTLEVAGVEQGECWGEFRLGRRARPLRLTAPDPRRCELEYALPGVDVRHRRRVEVRGRELRVADTITGHGRREMALRWHFAPGWAPATPESPAEWVAAGTPMKLGIELPAEWEWTVERTPFYPEFGREQERCSLVGRRAAELPAGAEIGMVIVDE